jgi:hypothetical protein
MPRSIVVPRPRPAKARLGSPVCRRQQAQLADIHTRAPRYGRALQPILDQITTQLDERDLKRQQHV